MSVSSGPTALEPITNTSPQVFLNIVLDDAVEEKDGGEKVRLGMVVCSTLVPCVDVSRCFLGQGLCQCVIGHPRKLGGYA
jgi:hypothetical protein